MWVIAGLLLGVVVLTSLVGFHTGPHSHLAAGGIGIVAAIWLVIMALSGYSAPLLWGLLSADVVVSAGVGVAAWKALSHPADIHPISRTLTKPDGLEGVATSDLDPDGTVHVRGEDWSAKSLNGRVKVGSRIQVVESEGVFLRVWGIDDSAFPGLDNGSEIEQHPSEHRS